MWSSMGVCRFFSGGKGRRVAGADVFFIFRSGYRKIPATAEEREGGSELPIMGEKPARGRTHPPPSARYLMSL